MARESIKASAASGVQLLHLLGHNKSIFHFTFRLGGKQLASAEQGGTVKIWSLEISQQVLTIPRDINGRIALGSDGHLIGTVFADILNVYGAKSGGMSFEKQISEVGFELSM